MVTPSLRRWTEPGLQANWRFFIFGEKESTIDRKRFTLCGNVLISMITSKKILEAVFYKSLTGKEPVRDWLLGLEKVDRKTIGEDMATLEFS